MFYFTCWIGIRVLKKIYRQVEFILLIKTSIILEAKLNDYIQIESRFDHHNKERDQICFVGVQLVVRDI